MDKLKVTLAALLLALCFVGIIAIELAKGMI